MMPGVVWTLRLPFATPSQNITDRMHWSQRARLQKDAVWEFMAQMRAHAWLVPVKVDYVVALHVMRHSRRFLDMGNFVGGCKPYVDALQKVGLIRDDTPQWLHDTYEQVVSRERYTTFALHRAEGST